MACESLGLLYTGGCSLGGGRYSILNVGLEASTRYLNVTMQIWISPRSSELGLKEQIVKLLKRTEEGKFDKLCPEEEKFHMPGPIVEVRKIDFPTVVHVVAHLR